MNSIPVFAENKFSWECAYVKLNLFYQDTWHCPFQLSKFPFEVVKCHIHLDLLDGQKWDPDFTVIMPQYGHLPYLVRTPRGFVH